MRIYVAQNSISPQVVSLIEDLGLVAVVATVENVPEMSEADILIFLDWSQSEDAYVELGVGLGRDAAVWVVGVNSKSAFEKLPGIVHVESVGELLEKLKAMRASA